MKVNKIVLGSLATTFILASSVSVFAASTYNSPSEIAAALTNRTVESVTKEREDSNKTYGSIAKEAGDLDEFKSENLEMKKEVIQEKVENKEITQEKADKIVEEIENAQENCDGTGNGEKIGQKYSLGFGKSMNSHRGDGNGKGKGLGLRDGSCLNQ
ncbi:hypothetical protein SAMN02910355_2875 [Terrisporobacter glycolicus]|nr:hypothetical protein SAMN02910355_2875 [Terrisporobacter glycolicus]